MHMHLWVSFVKMPAQSPVQLLRAGTEPATCAVEATHVLCPSFYLFSFTYLGTDKVGSFREAEP